MLNRADGTKGYFNHLVECFGAGAFEAGDGRFTRFVNDNIMYYERPPTACAFLKAWSTMEREVCGSQIQGPLDRDAENAGAQVESGLQAQLTNHIEKVRAQSEARHLRRARDGAHYEFYDTENVTY